MIRLTRINHVPFVLNSDLIEHLEVTPDTVITMTNGQKLVVRETAEEVVDRVVAFRRRIFGLPETGLPATGWPSIGSPEAELTGLGHQATDSSRVAG
jgi:flagellar protein FlbD